MKIAISDLKQLAKKRKLSHVIVFGFGYGQSHVATYGATKEQCGQAADFGNHLKKELRWPESLCNAQPSRVKKLEEENARLKLILTRLESPADLFNRSP